MLGRTGAGFLGGAGVSPGGDPVEELLAGLGGAARLFGEVEDALREAAPALVELDTPGAFRFLKETGPLLAGAGFGVLLPDWVRKARLGLKLTTRSQSPSGTSVTGPRFGLGDLVNFRYDVAVGDEALDEAELAELARLKVPLVRLRGQWVELDDAHLKAALKFLERNQAGTMTAADALAAGLRGPDEDVPLVGVDADGWLGDLLSGQADRRLRPMTTPAGFSGQLRPYQERGLSWLSFLGELGLGGILADDMGLGKTIQLLSLISAQTPAQPAPTLLVCPMSLVGNWQREAARFTPDLRVHVHHGADRLDGESLASALAGVDLVITTYGVATRDRAALSQLTWARVVCDEAQNIKNHATKQARAIRGLPAAARIALTGTPVENRLSELWSIMEFTNPGLLGPAEKFREKYAIPIERHGSPDAARALVRAHPAVHAPPPEDRQDDHLRPAGQAGDEGLVQPHPRAGEPVRGHGHRHAQPHRGRGRRHQPPRPGAGHDGQAQAGVQPSRPPARRRFPAAGPVRQAGQARGDLRRDRGRGRQGAVLHAVRRVRPDAAAAPGRQARLPGALPARRHDEEAAGRDGGPVRCAGRARLVLAVAEGRAAPGST